MYLYIRLCFLNLGFHLLFWITRFDTALFLCLIYWYVYLIIRTAFVRCQFYNRCSPIFESSISGEDTTGLEVPTLFLGVSTLNIGILIAWHLGTPPRPLGTSRIPLGTPKLSKGTAALSMETPTLAMGMITLSMGTLILSLGYLPLSPGIPSLPLIEVEFSTLGLIECSPEVDKMAFCQVSLMLSFSFVFSKTKIK